MNSIKISAVIVLGVFFISGCGKQSHSPASPTQTRGYKFVEREPLISANPVAQKYTNTVTGISFQYPQEFTLTAVVSQDRALFKRADECLASLAYYNFPFDKEKHLEFAAVKVDQPLAKRFRFAEAAHAIVPTRLELQNPRDVVIGQNTWHTYSIDMSRAKEKELWGDGCQQTKTRQIYILPAKSGYFKFSFFTINEQTIEKMLATVQIVAPSSSKK